MYIFKLRKLVFGMRETVGRSHGRIAAPRRSSITKRSYRFLDRRRTMFPGETLLIVRSYIYDPNRTGFISLCLTPNGTLFYILAVGYHPQQEFTVNLDILDRVKYKDFKGYSEILHNFSKGTVLTQIGFTTMAAGCSSSLLSSLYLDRNRYSVRLASGEYRLFMGHTIGVRGQISNNKHKIHKLQKAGESRRLGRKPRVRPSAMNPVDHPMGGRTKGGCAPCSRSGLLSLGTSTVKVNHKRHNHVIITPQRKVRLKALGRIKKTYSRKGWRAKS